MKSMPSRLLLCIPSLVGAFVPSPFAIPNRPSSCCVTTATTTTTTTTTVRASERLSSFNSVWWGAASVPSFFFFFFRGSGVSLRSRPIPRVDHSSVKLTRCAMLSCHSSSSLPRVAAAGRHTQDWDLWRWYVLSRKRIQTRMDAQGGVECVTLPACLHACMRAFAWFVVVVASLQSFRTRCTWTSPQTFAFSGFRELHLRGLSLRACFVLPCCHSPSIHG